MREKERFRKKKYLVHKKLMTLFGSSKIKSYQTQLLPIWKPTKGVAGTIRVK